MRQTLITEYFFPKTSRGSCVGVDFANFTWICLECGIDMGEMNPRQLCGKICCLFSYQDYDVE